MMSPMILTVAQLRRWALERLATVLREQLLGADQDSPPREPPPMLRERTDRDVATWVRSLASQMLNIDGSWAPKWDAVDSAVTRLLQARDMNAVQQQFDNVMRELGAADSLPTQGDDGFFRLSVGEKEAELALRNNHASSPIRPQLEREVEREILDLRFLIAVIQMCESNRRNRIKRFNAADETALQQAYSILDRYGRLPAAYAYIRTDELRPFQTYLSFADPGDGHLAVTVRDLELLEGLIVHIEHIDREDVLDPRIIEAYRMPPVRTAARVRLHVGLTTPCTAFIGRPVLEGGDYKLARLKAVHSIAGACSAMFAVGIAECKVAMDALTASQAVDFMQLVAGNVQRDPQRQRLSAAFNINSPLLDDRKEQAAAINVREPAKIARLAVDLAAQGQFNKVTWDGAHDGPSRPILGEQLSSEEVLHLVHRAHERGLETYISAGMLPEHMHTAALIGVGGVGIGLKLHALDRVTNRPGPIEPALVKKALACRNEAAQTVPGQAARELARLDWDHHRGLLAPAIEGVRNQLYEALRGWHSAAKPADKPGAPPAGSANAILQPLTRALQDLLGRIEAGYPRKGPAQAADFVARGPGTSEDVEPEPLQLWAERALKGLDPGMGNQIRDAMERQDWDQARGLLEALAEKRNA